MTIKKILFNSNLLMVVIPMVAMLLMCSFFYVIMDKIFFSDSNITNIKDGSLHQIQKIIDDTDDDLIIDNVKEQNNLMEQLVEKGFHLSAQQDGKILFTNMDQEEQSEISEYIASNQLDASNQLFSSNQTFWVLDDDFNVLWKSIETTASPIIFIAIDTNVAEQLNGVGPTAAFITSTILIIVSIVFMVVMVSLLLANKMVKKIMIPLNNLYDGAQRIQDGNFDEDIPCQGSDELEKVCDSFNKMQHQLKANIRKNENYERDRNEMLAGISHDLRTPLTSIKSYVRGLQDDIAKTPDKQKEYLDVIYRKACRIEDLINSLFLFSKLETGNFPFDFHMVSIQNFIVTLLDSLEYDLTKNHALLTLKITCTEQKVLLDGAQMTRVITNILDNSIKYNSGRQIHIIVTLSEQDGRILLRIQDDGVGVSAQQLSHLFDSFYRGDESRNSALDGSGLGLAIAKNIVTAHGGQIFAENNNGLTVSIDLPVKKEAIQ